MTFGQESGPPASAKQIRELLASSRTSATPTSAMHGPMRFTQRQAAGKFPRDEAEAFVGQLLDAESDGSNPVDAPAWRQRAQEQVMSCVPSEQLAAELRCRRWTANEP